MKRSLQFILFFGVLTFFLYIGNFVIYDALSVIFHIFDSSQLLFLASMLGIFSGSLVASTIIGNKYYNWFTRFYYTLSAVWIGFFVYMFLASFAYGVIMIISGQLFVEIGAVLIFMALVISIYGIIHAKKIYVMEIKISLPQLPDVWRGRKAVWISDLHLGQLHGSSFVKKIVEKVNKLSPDIIFIGGDLFDGTTSPDLITLIAPLKKLSGSLGVYFITGNHEEFGNSDKFISAVKTIGINILQDRMVEIDGIQLIGVDYHNASDKNRFKKILSELRINTHKPSILLKHEPKDLNVALEAGISLQISGHTHQAQLWPLRYVANLIYKNFTYGLKTLGEMKIYTSSGVGTWGPPMRVGTNNEIVLFTFIQSTP
ncbi:MAG: metallophosphoesterase [Minisyncoccia bacterium]